jgi:4-amino-4-deoxy-L-arabinose transferase-like glycosyltransferase
VQSRRILLAYALIALIGLARVASTHRVFSAVLDEPIHLLAGYEWLHGMPYTMDPSHPPLGRIVGALPAVLGGQQTSEDDPVKRGLSLLYWHDHYERNLANARRPMLLFLLIGMIATAAWTARYFGHVAGVIAMAMFASLPPLLGNAGLVTTDLPIAAMLTLAFLALDVWLDGPTLKRSLLLGLAIGLAALSKFSFLVFFPVSALVMVMVRQFCVAPAISPASTGEEPRRRDRRRHTGYAVIALAIAFFTTWAGYRFDFDTLRHAAGYPYGIATVFVPESMTQQALWFDEHVPLPAPLYVTGVGMVKEHNRKGHEAFFFGKIRWKGWWYYFPVLFFFKTPLPFIALALIGMVLIARRAPEALALALIPIAMMLSVLPSHINIGVRHILPIYPPLCAVAAFAVLTLWRNARARIAAVALLAWLFIGVALAHPDYMAWFNEAAGKHPERIAIDSNLDWGQDWLRLARVVREKHIESVNVLFTGSMLLQFHGIHGDEVSPWIEKPGWYAMSLQGLAMNPDARRGAWRWLDRYPYTMVGKSIRLYHVQ